MVLFSDNNEADFEAYASELADEQSREPTAHDRRKANRERMRRLRASRDPSDERRKNRERMRRMRAIQALGGGR